MTDRAGQEPAFPTKWVESDNGPQISLGLTKREWFAGMALSRLMTESKALPQYWNEQQRKEVAASAWAMSDAMLKEGVGE